MKREKEVFEINGVEIFYFGGASLGYDDEYHWNGTYDGTIKRELYSTNHNYYFHIRSGKYKSFGLYCTVGYHQGRDILIDSGKVKTIKEALRRIRAGVLSFEDHSYQLDEWVMNHTYPVFTIKDGEPEIIGVYHHYMGLEAEAQRQNKMNECYYYHKGVPDYKVHTTTFALRLNTYGPNAGKYYIYKMSITWCSRCESSHKFENQEEMIQKMLMCIESSTIPNLRAA